MKITVVGTGYVGLTTGVGLADFGCKVCCVDINEEKIKLLNNGQLPFYEPGLQEVLEKNVNNGRLAFSGAVSKEIETADVVFIAVGTPQQESGEADLSFVKNVADTIGSCLLGYTIIVTKSTVPVGTNEEIKAIIQNKVAERLETGSHSVEFDVVSNPEFLREGRALFDFLHPDRVVIGADSERPLDTMKKIYRPLYLNEVPFVFTDLRSAELIKYSSNCFLATKVAFINEMARLCDALGADVKAVSYAMGKDGRIGNKFLHPGPGYGGSCFPKDTEAIAYIGRVCNSPLSIVEAVIDSNKRQKDYSAEKIIRNINTIENPVVGILGISFKSETDDIRESPALDIIRNLLENGVTVKVYDPKAMDNLKKVIGDVVVYCEDEYDAVAGCDGVAIVTEWNQFRNLDLKMLRDNMRGRMFFDLRNIYSPSEVLANGLEYIGMGQHV